jgi:hypothetical protein
MQSLDITATVSPEKVTWLDTNSPSSRLLSRVEGCVVRAGLESTGVVGRARAFLNTHDSTRWLSAPARAVLVSGPQGGSAA